MSMDWPTGVSHTLIILLLLRQDIMRIAMRVKAVRIEMKNGHNGEELDRK